MSDQPTKSRRNPLLYHISQKTLTPHIPHIPSPNGLPQRIHRHNTNNPGNPLLLFLSHILHLNPKSRQKIPGSLHAIPPPSRRRHHLHLHLPRQQRPGNRKGDPPKTKRGHNNSIFKRRNPPERAAGTLHLPCLIQPEGSGIPQRHADKRRNHVR